MVEAKQASDWDHTASLLAMQNNTAFGQKRSNQKTPAAFNPYRRRLKRVVKLTREQTRSRLQEMAGLKRKEGSGVRGQG